MDKNGEIKMDDAVWQEIPVIKTPVYKINERPKTWWECLLFGWQHTLVDISPFVLPLAVAGAIGMSAPEKAQFINFCLFAMGVATILQTTIGNRLPIIQGPSATLTGALAPIAGQAGAPFMWGGVFAGAIIEMLVGASRILKYLRRLFPPAVSGVVIICIGIALGQPAIRLMIGDGRPLNFVLAITVIAIICVLQISLQNVLKGILSRGAIFISIWAVGLGIGGMLNEVNWSLVAQKSWFALPRLFPYGGPGFGWEFGMAAILVILVGYLGSMVESLGDYAATCAVSGETYLVTHMNRGIFAEGLGSGVAAILGGLPCTSYTQNIGIIATTRVASRFVVQIAAVILILYGLCPKFGALLVAMPKSVLGGVFVIVCGMIAVSGIRLLGVAKNTTANFLLVGITLICAIGIPIYTQFVLGEQWLDRLHVSLKLVVTNTVVLAVIIAIVLNLILNIILRGDVEESEPSA
ncbi:MAG: uracil-xanthine permease family protein [Planctomycetota bacterium]|jgi:uracil-xanthine permease